MRGLLVEYISFCLYLISFIPSCHNTLANLKRFQTYDTYAYLLMFTQSAGQRSASESVSSTVTSPTIEAASLASASAAPGARLPRTSVSTQPQPPPQPQQQPTLAALAASRQALAAATAGARAGAGPEASAQRPSAAGVAGGAGGAGAVPDTPRKQTAPGAPPETPRGRLPVRDPSLTKEQRLARIAGSRPCRTVTLIRPPPPYDESAGSSRWLCCTSLVFGLVSCLSRLVLIHLITYNYNLLPLQSTLIGKYCVLNY